MPRKSLGTVALAVAIALSTAATTSNATVVPADDVPTVEAVEAPMAIVLAPARLAQVKAAQGRDVRLFTLLISRRDDRLAAAQQAREAEVAAQEAAAAEAAAQQAAREAAAQQAASAATPAPAPKPVDGRPHHVVVGEQALARLTRVDIGRHGWRVAFHAGRDGYLGMTDQRRRVIDIWVRDNHSVDQVLATLAHEAAHVLDYEFWTDDLRRDWMRMRGITTSWWPSCTCEDRGYGAGDIAEAVAVLQAGRAHWHGHFAAPTDEQLAWLAARLG